MKCFNRDAHQPKIAKNKEDARPIGSKDSEFLPEDEYINKVINGDCLEKLKGIPDNSVDGIISDLPYGIKKAEWDKIPTTEALMECNRVLKDGGFFAGFVYNWGNLLEQHLANLREAGFDTGCTPLFWVHHNNRPVPPYIKKHIEKVKGKGAAENFEGACASYRPCAVVDIIIVAQKPMKEKSAYLQAVANGKGITWLDKGRIPKYENGVPRIDEPGYLASNIIASDNALGKHSGKYDLHRWAGANLSHLPKEILETYPCFVVPRPSDREKNAGLSGKGNTHETVKPIEVMCYLLSIFSREGDVVLDMYAGSGTTCMAAALLNRRYIGIELNPRHCETARRRIEHIQQEMASGGNEMIEGIRRKILPSSTGKDSPIEHPPEKVISRPVPTFFSRRVKKPKVSPDVSKGTSSRFPSMSQLFTNAGASGGRQSLSNSLERFVASQKKSKASMSLPSMNAAETKAKQVSSNSLAGFVASQKKSKSTRDVPKRSTSPFASTSLPPMNTGSPSGKQASLNSLGVMFKPKKQQGVMSKQGGFGASEDANSDLDSSGVPPWMSKISSARHPEENVVGRSSAKSKPSFF